MCHQRADSSFLYKKALLAALRRRALTPSKMVPREERNTFDRKIANIVIKIKLVNSKPTFEKSKIVFEIMCIWAYNLT